MKLVPAWKLLDILDLDEKLVMLRREQEQRTKDALAKSSAVQDFAKPGEPTEPDDEFSRFEDLTRRLVQTPKPRPAS